LTSPGDAKKFWHKKLNIVNSQSEMDDEADKTGQQNEENNGQNDGDFEFAGDDEQNTTQTLAGVDENDATQLQQEQPEEKAETEFTPDRDQHTRDSEQRQRRGFQQMLHRATTPTNHPTTWTLSRKAEMSLGMTKTIQRQTIVMQMQKIAFRQGTK
jgi:hypothetical protein